MTKYRIMSFDGGDTGGTLSLQLLNRLAKQTPQLVGPMFSRELQSVHSLPWR